jgi:putative membrane protein
MPNTPRLRLATLPALALAALTLVACSGTESATADSAGASDTAVATTPAATTPAAAAAPNDAQIAHIAVTANSIDSAAGARARQKASSKEVKDFAQSMVNDHGAVNKQAVALATRLGVTPEDNETSRSLQSSANTSSSSIEAKSGADFDRAYIDNEVAFHQTVLDALDRTLIPNAQNAELKGLLEKVRPNIAAHLDHAKRIQTSLAK